MGESLSYFWRCTFKSNTQELLCHRKKWCKVLNLTWIAWNVNAFKVSSMFFKIWEHWYVLIRKCNKDIRFQVNCLICECLWNNVPLFVPTFSHIRERNKDWYSASSHNKWEDTDTSLFCFQLLQCRIINTSKATNNFYTHVNNEWKGEELGVSQVGQESSFVYVSEPHWGTFLIVENVHSGSARTVL